MNCCKLIFIAEEESKKFYEPGKGLLMKLPLRRTLVPQVFMAAMNKHFCRLATDTHKRMSYKNNIHTTNYFDTFIEVAEDCPVTVSEIPQSNKDNKTVANMQYDLLAKNPYKYTSDDILFQVYADRNDLTKAEYKKTREVFFSKGQACFRASPLTKRYGFGVHANGEGKIAIYGVETKEYARFLKDDKIKKIKAMRTSKK